MRTAVHPVNGRGAPVALSVPTSASPARRLESAFPAAACFRGMSIRATAILALCATVSGCMSRHASASASAVRTRYDRTPDVVYTPAGWPRELRADLYRPRGAGPWPGVLLIHGGSWSGADNRWHMRLLARRLAGRGYAVMSVAYRGYPDFIYPVPVEDCRQALRWWRAHATAWGLDPARVGTYGFSAGGHLAAYLAVAPEGADTKVQALVAASAPTDLVSYPDSPILQRFLGATYAERPDLYTAASPTTHVSGDAPPTFQYHGTADTTVSPDHARVFKAALDRAGVRNELHWLPGRKHASVLIFGGRAEDAAIDFLDSALR